MGSVGFSLLLRVLYLAQQWRIDMSEHPTFLAAEGVVGLMGRHIVAGERPLFYYGQYYMGALEAYLAAGLFYLFGDSMTALRAVPAVFAVAWIPLAGAIAARLYGRRAGLLAAALVALPSQFVFEWGFQARGGHAEHVTLVLLTLWLVLLALEHMSRGVLIALGFVMGLSLWVNQMAVAYMPVFAYALVSSVKLRSRQAALLVA
ncbi:MAG TPA: glycosyltransferase family 39 protein, partial [Dehalococcoidia bacterium]|nr:glycosyltransferase family 39 protein [Dehalococcoidia bacterium]